MPFRLSFPALALTIALAGCGGSSEEAKRLANDACLSAQIASPGETDPPPTPGPGMTQDEAKQADYRDWAATFDEAADTAADAAELDAQWDTLARAYSDQAYIASQLSQFSSVSPPPTELVQQNIDNSLLIAAECRKAS